ncbi:MAG: hypothetical protein EAZ43_10545 [Betaproteobacteria bacterium]|nr:MAG: hypothetical protein EAZ43_10545 [Betaproteobacteria bacterium]
MTAAQTPKPPWWIGSAINLAALALAAATTYLYVLGVKHEFLFKLPRFLWAIFGYFGMPGLVVACLLLSFAAWWVVALIAAARLYRAVLASGTQRQSRKQCPLLCARTTGELLMNGQSP